MSSISLRLLLFNLLLVFLPVAGFLYLDTYEKQLLEAQERAMVQQGRILAAAFSGRGELETGDIEHLLAGLNRRSEARLRVVDPQGHILADSSRGTASGGTGSEAAPETSEPAPARRNALYRVGAFFYDIYRRFLPPEPGVERAESPTPGRLGGREVRAALSGRYGRAMRVSPGQRSVTLSSAIPVESRGRIVGAVVVSQSTYRILQDLYVIRLRISEVCAVSLAAALILSLFVSATIVRPIRRLRDEAEAIVDRQGRLRRRFRVLRRGDEIGDLARALERLTRRLEEHVRQLETFASDVAHELKNPLASIRASMEMLSEVDDPQERRRFQRVVVEEVARMEHQLSELTEITRIDARLEAEEQVAVPLNGLLQQIAERFRLRENGRIQFLLEMPQDVITVRAAPSRLTQVFENVLDNAASFSPEGAAVRVVLSRSAEGAAVTVSDQGPGIPASHAAKIFDRFFSYRREGERGGRRHTGLGLAIVKTIVEGYGGTISAANNPDGGAAFTVRLPASRTGVMPLRT